MIHDETGFFNRWQKWLESSAKDDYNSNTIPIPYLNILNALLPHFNVDPFLDSDCLCNKLGSSKLRSLVNDKTKKRVVYEPLSAYSARGWKLPEVLCVKNLPAVNINQWLQIATKILTVLHCYLHNCFAHFRCWLKEKFLCCVIFISLWIIGFIDFKSPLARVVPVPLNIHWDSIEVCNNSKLLLNFNHWPPDIWKEIW